MKIFSDLIEDEKFNKETFSQELKRTISKIDNKLEVFKDDDEIKNMLISIYPGTRTEYVSN